MNEYVKGSIDSRRQAFTNSYELTSEYEKKVNELFKKIEDFGKDYSDVMDFETKFMASSLNTEYTNLFTEIATNCKCIIPEPVETGEQGKKGKVIDEIASDAKYLLDDITMPARRKAREEFDKKMRDTPLGKLEQMSNTTSVFKRIFKK